MVKIQVKNFIVPSYDEINQMNLSELEELKEKLEPFYAKRIELDLEEFREVSRYVFLILKIKEKEFSFNE